MDLEKDGSKITNENLRLRKLAANALLVASHGRYDNGVLDSTGCIDEGEVIAGAALKDLDEEAKALGLVIKSTIHDNEQYYIPSYYYKK